MLRLHTQSAFQESLSSTVLFMASKIVRHRKTLSIPPHLRFLPRISERTVKHSSQESLALFNRVRTGRVGGNSRASHKAVNQSF